MGSEFLPVVCKFCILLHCQASHTEASKQNSNFAKRKEVNRADANRIRWRRIVNVNKTIELDRWCPGPQKDFKLAMASRRAALSGNTSLVTTFSSYVAIFLSACLSFLCFMFAVLETNKRPAFNLANLKASFVFFHLPISCCGAIMQQVFQLAR